MMMLSKKFASHAVRQRSSCLFSTRPSVTERLVQTYSARATQTLLSSLRYRTSRAYSQDSTTKPKPSAPLLDVFDFTGKTTVITGGGRGIGLQLAKDLADLACNLALMDLMEPNEDVAALRKRGVNVKYYQTDVTNEKSLEDSFTKARQDFGILNNCVTAAGIAYDQPFLEHTWDKSQRVLDVNVMGTFFSAQMATRHFREQETPGNIVMIASIASHIAIPSQNVSIYGASKAAVRLLGSALAVELAPFKIRVNTLSPGFIETRMTGDLALTNPHLARVLHTYPPTGRIGQPGDLSLAVAYLLSDGASYTTGADLPVTGGLHFGRIEL